MACENFCTCSAVNGGVTQDSVLATGSKVTSCPEWRNACPLRYSPIDCMAYALNLLVPSGASGWCCVAGAQ